MKSNLKAVLAIRGMSQKELSEKTNIGIASIGNYVAGRGNATSSALAQIAEVLNCSVVIDAALDVISFRLREDEPDSKNPLILTEKKKSMLYPGDKRILLGYELLSESARKSVNKHLMLALARRQAETNWKYGGWGPIVFEFEGLPIDSEQYFHLWVTFHEAFGQLDPDQQILYVRYKSPGMTLEKLKNEHRIETEGIDGIDEQIREIEDKIHSPIYDRLRMTGLKPEKFFASLVHRTEPTQMEGLFGETD